MPIMDGFEACERIFNYLTKQDSIFDARHSNNPSIVSLPLQINNFSDVIEQNNSFKSLKNRQIFLSSVYTPERRKSNSNNSFKYPLDLEFKYTGPIIVALTADESPEMASKIMTYPFLMHKSRILKEHTDDLLKEIKLRSDEKQIKRK